MKAQCTSCKKVYEGSSLKDFNKQGLKRIGRKWKCTPCCRKERAEHRDKLLHEVVGVRRRVDLEKEWAEKRRLREEEKAFNQNNFPVLKGAVVKDVKKSKQNHFYLTKTEKYFIYKKYSHIGVPDKKIKERMDNLVNQLNGIVNKMRSQNVPEEKMKSKFKEEFARMVMEEEEKYKEGSEERKWQKD